MRRNLSQVRFEHRLAGLLLLVAGPGFVAVLALSWLWELAGGVPWSLVGGAAVISGFGAWALFREVVRPLQTISNLVAAMREEDFSTRASGAHAGDALGEVFLELNALSELLQEQRLGAIEATALLRTVMQEIEVAVFTFDEEHRLKLVNRAGQKLLARPAERLLDCTAEELGLGHCLEGETNRTIQAAFPSGVGRWNVRRSSFRQGGRPRHLLVFADLSRALREEERLAWQRLIRVLGHEINNSLAPIKSISETLDQLVRRNPLPGDLKEDMTRGLGVIATRADNLSGFMATYTQLARLPAPVFAPVELRPLLERIAGLETRVPVRLKPGPAVTVEVDPGQLEQLIINLLRNGAEAVLSHPAAHSGQSPGLTVSWACSGPQVSICVEDDGPGLANTANLFVPFFTTKPGGSGIGLVLGRQIAEAHSGTLTLENRCEASGCRATLRLPIERAVAGGSA